MNFTITVDTNNIEKDIIETIRNFSKEQMDKLIKSIKFKKDGNNIKGDAIFFRYPDCEQILLSLTDFTKVPFDIRKKIKERTRRVDTELIFIHLLTPEKVKNEFTKNIIELVQDRINIEQKFCDTLSNDRYNSQFYNICFKIISSEEYFQKFLNYSNNLDIFDSKYTQEDYVFELANILGYQAQSIYKENSIYKYPITTYNMLLRYLKLRKIVNVDIKMLGEEIFNQGGKTSYSKEYQQFIDNDWEVNPKLAEYVMNDMNPEYNDLEKISHIYIKLCQALRYNLGYHIKKWTADYNKQRQESITPENNKIICSEYAMIFTNLVNKLDENIEARCIITGKEQHLSVGILIRNKNIRIDLDSTKVIDNFDDLARVKLGMPLVGINYLCDREKEFEYAFNKVYHKLHGEYQIKTEDLIEAYEIIVKNQEIKVNFYENMKEFIFQMKEKNVVGSELLSIFKMLNNIEYFGPLKYSIIGQDLKLTFRERALLETAEEVLDGLEENIIINYKEEYYLLRLDTGELIQMTKQELNKLFEENKMRYFNPKHKIEGVGIESCKKK